MTSVQTLLVTVTDGPGWVGNWSPGIGDPTWTGWVTTVAYFVASVLCLGAHRHYARAAAQTAPAVPARPAAVATSMSAPAARRLALIWLILTVSLFLLGVNKQLDLQTLFTELGRIVAFRQGWYQRRRVVQASFVVGLAVLGIAGIALMFRLARGHLRQLRLALAGTVFLVAFVAIRATSFHLVDKVLSHQVAVVRMNAIIELGGIALVALGALRNWRPPPRR
jgi:hypothetical protein